ncbi:MAG: ATP-binding protein [Bacteroidales bacterium]|nr:ATP-binding protein [Bacteroidales bacterium]
MKPVRIEYKIPVIYFLIGIAWIYFSDTFFGALAQTEEHLIFFNVIKGFVYVIITSLLLFFLLKGYVERKKAADNIIKQRNIELEEQNRELIRLKQKAEENDRLKTAFLQNMSHEIRTPMNAIMGFCDLLPEYLEDKEKLENFTGIINQRCRDLVIIIDDVLDIAKIESGQLPVKYEECNPEVLFQDLYEMFISQQKRLGKEHITLDYKLECDKCQHTFITDVVKIRQILINLIGNSLKFTDEGYIRFGCRQESPDLLTFYIEDTGPGIPPDKQNIVFERFVQISPHPTRLYGGTGLGLSIVKGLVDLLGGKIELNSVPEVGTTFLIRIPFHPTNP